MKNTIKNVGIGSVLQVFTILLSFVSRTFFVRLLGNDYLSCDGLFTNILTILSFSELGIGSAIIYSLYKPIALGDQEQIGKLMNLFATAYRFIAGFILVAGLCVVPFLKWIITDVPDVQEDLSVLYILFLLNSVASYVFGYKRSYLIASQKNYIVLLIQHGINTFRIVAQIIILYITKDYILFLVTMIVCTFLNNVVSTIITNKRYPWINDYIHQKLTKEERKPIFSNIRSIVHYKIGSVILNGTDNILISVTLQTALVGLYSNYYLIINAINAIVNQASGGMVASIGNYNVSASKEENYIIFQKLYFISFWVFGLISILLVELLTPFIAGIWLGDAYRLEYPVVIALSLLFYISSINIVPSMYRTSMGYFKEARNCPILAAVINIALSVLLAKLIGLSGIFFATAIAKLVTYNIIDPYLVFRKGFSRTFTEFVKLFGGYGIVLLIGYGAAYFAVNSVSVAGIWGLVIKFLTCFVVVNVIFAIAFSRNRIFRDLIAMLKAKVLRAKK